MRDPSDVAGTTAHYDRPQARRRTAGRIRLPRETSRARAAPGLLAPGLLASPVSRRSEGCAWAARAGLPPYLPPPVPRIPCASGIPRDRAVFRTPLAGYRRHCGSSVPPRRPFCEDRRSIASIFAKRFFMVKISRTYTVNYLRQEKGLRDHDGGWAPVGLDCHLSRDISR
jgi:hypothetical protein